jgi:hypothetical protein
MFSYIFFIHTRFCLEVTNIKYTHNNELNTSSTICEFETTLIDTNKALLSDPQ